MATAQLTVTEQSRTCRTCGKIKPITEFYYTARNHWYSRTCKECQTRQQQESRIKTLQEAGATPRDYKPKGVVRLARLALPDVDGLRVCTECGESKPLEQFPVHRQARAGRARRCCTCKNAATRCRAKLGARYRRKGLTIEDFQELYDAQNGVCAICSQPEIRTRSGAVRILCIDHDHQTGMIRGLLCSRCNVILGQVRDIPETLLAAAAYLVAGGTDSARIAKLFVPSSPADNRA